MRQAEKLFSRSSNDALAALGTEIQDGLVKPLMTGDREGAAAGVGLLLSRIKL